jgi:hypothetical protein
MSATRTLAQEREQDMRAFEHASTFYAASDVARAMVALGRWGTDSKTRFLAKWGQMPMGVSDHE